MPVIGIVAGETSGDLLGAELIRAVKKKLATVHFTGIGGEEMRRAGCECLYPASKLAVMGITEVAAHYFELRRIRADIRQQFTDRPVDLFIGIDAPDFNIGLESDLRRSGIRTLHYVSPSVWAWRESRLKKIARAVDMILTLFPFETPYYENYGIPVRCVGHPLARRIPVAPDPAAVRERLGLPQDATIVALMPGSRAGEWSRLSEPFLRTALWCSERKPELQFITNLIDDQAQAFFSGLSAAIAPQLRLTRFSGVSLDVMAAADAVLLASGTVALEAMLLKRPMVVAYRVNWLTYQILKRMIRVPCVSLPNLLAGRALVPECLQYDCRPDIMGPALLKSLDDTQYKAMLLGEFTDIHKRIRLDADDLIASTVMELLHA